MRMSRKGWPLALAALGVAGCASAGSTLTVHHPVTSTAALPSLPAVTNSPALPSLPAAVTASASPAGPLAVTGSQIALEGNDAGEQVTVTVVRVIAHAQPGDSFTTAPAGYRLYAVQFRLYNAGTAAYSDAPDNSAVVTDDTGQSYDSSIDAVAGCPSFPGTEKIAPGGTGLGCVTFEVPRGALIDHVQFTLDSGFGPQTGQWDVSGASQQ